MIFFAPPEGPAPGSVLDVLPVRTALRADGKRADRRTTIRVLVLGYVERPGEARLPQGTDGVQALDLSGRLPGFPGWATAVVRRRAADLPLETRLRDGDEIIVRPKVGSFVVNVTTPDGRVRPFYLDEKKPLATFLGALPKPWWDGAGGGVVVSSTVQVDRSFRAKLGDLGKTADRLIEPFDSVLLEARG